MYQDLKGKLAVVTGAALQTGIGFGIAERLAENDMDIIIADLESQKEHIEASVRHLRKTYGVDASSVFLDLSSVQSIQDAAAAISARTDCLHALVNNAGVNLGAAKVGDYDPENWKKVISINLIGQFLLTRLLLPRMKRGSAIVNVASRAGKRPLPTCSAYSVSKAGLIMFTRCLAVEYGAAGIRANALCPGQILTEMNKRRYAREAAQENCTPEETMKRAIATVPLGRIGLPADVGSVAAFLVSDASGYMTGQALNVTGGQITEL